MRYNLVMPQTRRLPGKMKGTHTKTPQPMPQHSARQVCNTPACLFTNRHTDYHVANKTLRHAARPAVPLIAGSLSSKVFQRYVAAAGLLAYPSDAHLPGIFRPVAFAQNSAARRVVRTDTGHTACQCRHSLWLGGIQQRDCPGFTPGSLLVARMGELPTSREP